MRQGRRSVAFDEFSFHPFTRRQAGNRLPKPTRILRAAQQEFGFVHLTSSTLARRDGHRRSRPDGGWPSVARCLAHGGGLLADSGLDTSELHSRLFQSPSATSPVRRRKSNRDATRCGPHAESRKARDRLDPGFGALRPAASFSHSRQPVLHLRPGTRPSFASLFVTSVAATHRACAATSRAVAPIGDRLAAPGECMIRP